jgi:hypothetical protein
VLLRELKRRGLAASAVAVDYGSLGFGPQVTGCQKLANLLDTLPSGSNPRQNTRCTK